MPILLKVGTTRGPALQVVRAAPKEKGHNGRIPVVL
jgi:hypothetical protein